MSPEIQRTLALARSKRAVKIALITLAIVIANAYVTFVVNRAQYDKGFKEGVQAALNRESNICLSILDRLDIEVPKEEDSNP